MGLEIYTPNSQPKLAKNKAPRDMRSPDFYLAGILFLQRDRSFT